MPTMSTLNFLSVLPEAIVLGAACAILVLDAFLPDRLRHLSFWLTQLALLVAAWLVYATAAGEPVRAMNGMVIDDMLSDVFRFFTCIAVSLTLFYSRGYLEARGLFRGETFVLALTTLLGMMVMISAGNFITLYMGLELQALSLYAMVAMHRTSKQASEAAMKYFVLGALASGMLLYGMSMIYGATGSLDLVQVGVAVLSHQGNPMILLFGLVFVVSGIGFKLGAVPYHMWVPDVYDGAPTAVTLLIGTAPKLAAFAFMMRLLAIALGDLALDWQDMLIVLSLLSMVLGNVIAIAQTNIKRMLAYSTIANMGFMLMGFLAGNLDGFTAAMFYSVAYVLTTLASFGIVMLLSRAGFRGRPDRRLQGPQPPVAVVGADDADRDVLARGHSADDRLLREVLGDHGCGGRRVRLARRRCGPVVAGGRVLLPAHREAHVFRRADGSRADRRPARQPGLPFGERARAGLPRHVPAAAGGNLLWRARVVRICLVAAC